MNGLRRLVSSLLRPGRTHERAEAWSDPTTARLASSDGSALGPGRRSASAPSPAEQDLAVRLVGLTKRYGSVAACDRLDLDVRREEMLVILGPSGCGKTTLLRCIAGFELPDEGRIEIAGRVVASPDFGFPPERRRVGVVFQDLALFPHLSIADNVAYGLRRRPDRRARVSELLELVGLAGLGDRMSHELSGGMQQRVALARALAPEPEIVLLDEPFSSLDVAHRTRLRFEVREILRRAGATAIFVTHDQDEALTIADRVAVMVRGRIAQTAPPEVLYEAPANPFVATFVGIANLVPGDLDGHVARTPLGTIALAPTSPRRLGRGLVLFRPEQLQAEPVGEEARGDARWRIIGRRFAGSEILLEVADPDGIRLWCEADVAARRLRIGELVALRLRGERTVAYAIGSGGGEGSPPGRGSTDVS